MLGPRRPRPRHRSVRGADARRHRRRRSTELRAQYDTGADPAVVLADLAEFTHFVTRVKIVPAVADDVSLTEAERTRGRAFAEKLSMRVLARTWQMLLKGIAEVQAAGRPLAAAEMVLVRIAYAADLPTPDEVIRSLSDGTSAGVARQPGRWRRAAAQRAGARRPRAMRVRAMPVASRGISPARRAAGRAGARRAAAGDPGAPQRQPRPLAVGSFEESDRAGGAEARHRRQGRARARRPAGALRGWPARDRAGTERGEDAGARPVAQILAMDRPALDGRGVGRTGSSRR